MAWTATGSLQGPPGIDGSNGNTIHSVEGAPSDALGVNGDFALDINSYILYGPKVGGTWSVGTSLAGPAGPAVGGKDVTVEYGVVGDGTTNDAAAMQAALNDKGVLFIPPGKHVRVNSMLRIYRDTHLIISPGASIDRGANITLMVNGNADQSLGGFTGEGSIRIDGGGTLDMKGTTFTGSNNCLSFGHGQNITVEDITIKDESGYHHLEINACKNVRIRNVRFMGYVDNSIDASNFYKEVCQIDLAKPNPLNTATSDTFPSFGPWDNTTSEDVVLESCYFGPSGTPGTTAPNVALGAHSATKGVRFKGIDFLNNYCEALRFWGVSGYAFTGMTVRGNKFIGCDGGVRAEAIRTADPEDTYDTASTPVQTSTSQDERAIVISDNIFLDIGGSGDRDAIKVVGEATGLLYGVTIANNIIDGAASGARGINCAYAERLTVTGNSMYNVNGSAIYLDHCDDSTVMGNTIRVAGGTGIFATGSTGLAIGPNQIRSPSGDAIQVSTCTDFTINANTIRLAGTHGINILTNCVDFVVSNNTVRGASRNTNNVSAAYRSSATCSDGTWIGNRAARYTSGNDYAYAYSVTNTCSNFTRQGNTFEAGVTGTVLDASTSRTLRATDADSPVSEVLVLEAAATVPAGTPAGTVILRKP